MQGASDLRLTLESCFECGRKEAQVGGKECGEEDFRTFKVKVRNHVCHEMLNVFAPTPTPSHVPSHDALIASRTPREFTQD